MAVERKKLPHFRNEEEEREFWSIHDSTEYLDWQKARPALFSSLRPSTRSISIRLPESLLAELRTLANKLDVPYQSLIKMLLSECVRKGSAPRLDPLSKVRSAVLRSAPGRGEGTARGVDEKQSRLKPRRRLGSARGVGTGRESRQT